MCQNPHPISVRTHVIGSQIMNDALLRILLYYRAETPTCVHYEIDARTEQTFLISRLRDLNRVRLRHSAISLHNKPLTSFEV